jgi:hypothetical protein
MRLYILPATGRGTTGEWWRCKCTYDFVIASVARQSSGTLVLDCFPRLKAGVAMTVGALEVGAGCATSHQ